jgi:hypothetical protein
MASIKNLSQGATGQLLWNDLEIQLKQDSFQQINSILPITTVLTGTNSLTIESLFKPSSVSVGNGIIITQNDTTGILTLNIDTEVMALKTWIVANFLSPLNPGTTGVGPGLSSTMTANSFIISVDQNFDRRNLFILQDANNVLRNITTNIAGNLLFDNNMLAMDNDVSNGFSAMSYEISLKQDSLNHYTETTGVNTILAQTFDDATPTSVHMVWYSGSYNNVANSHQEINISGPNGVWQSFVDVGTGTCYLTIQIKSATVDHVLLSINDGTSWTGMREIKIEGLSTVDWQTHTWQFDIPDNSNLNFHIGVEVPYSANTQASGNILIKNLRLYRNSDTSTISTQLTCTDDIICTRTMRATGFASTSDESIKENIQDASIEDCISLFDAVDVKVYNRKDIGGNRIGFIAQNIQENITPEFDNIISTQYVNNTPLLAVDYSRMCCILWGVVKDLKQRITDLEDNSNP